MQVENEEIGESIKFGKECLSKSTPDLYKAELQHHNLKHQNKVLLEDLRPKYILMRECKMVKEIATINKQRQAEYLPKLDTETDSTI